MAKITNDPAASLVLPTLLRSILSQLENRDVTASQTLHAALSKTESVHPGFCYDFVKGLVKKADAENNINLNESLLRIQGKTESFFFSFLVDS